MTAARGIYIPRGTPLAERLLIRSERVLSGCLLWTAYVDEWGYGRLSWEGKIIGAHQAAWIVHRGPIPEGAQVLHHCDTPPCIEIEHLYLGSNERNTHDKVMRGRSRTKITPCIAFQIIADPRSAAIVADQFGVSPSLVTAIRRGERWKYLPELLKTEM